MKRLLIWAGLALALPLAVAQSRSYCRESNTVLRVLEDYHFQARERDRRLSHDWFWASLEAFDPEALYFTREDVVALKRYEYGLFKPNPQRCDYFDAVEELMEARLVLIEGWLEDLTPATRAYDPKRETLIIRDDPKNRYAANEADLQERWTTWLQYQAVRAWFQQEDEDRYPQKELFLAQFDSLKEVAFRRLSCDLEGLSTSLDDYLGVRWLNSLAECYDPHSTYFSPAEAGNFEADLATESYSFGLEVSKNDNGEIEISQLTPGGPAWKSNELNQGDVVLSIRLGKGDPVDLSCSNLAQLTAVIRGSDSDNLTLKVRKSSGQIQEVTLKREKMAVQENRVTGLVLEGEGRKVGYLYLPGFYTDWEDDGKKGLASDVASEVLKLQLAGIEGLILDLRHNGGGAVNEAIDLAGIFIDEGPIALYQDRKGGPYPIKDENRGTAYRGPLLVMVDGLSASASEIFAAAIQDYQRGLVVGTPSFGKASGQVIIPLAEINGLKGANGILKVTTDRFYRVNRSTHQALGVQPDLLIPSIWSGVMPRESEYPHSFRPDTTEKAVKYLAADSLPVAALRQRQQARHPLAEIIQLRDSIPAIWQRTSYITPTFETYLRDVEEINTVYAAVDTLQEHLTLPFTVSNHPQMATLLSLDESLKLRNDRQQARLRRDLQLGEAFFILSDLIDLEKR